MTEPTTAAGRALIERHGTAKRNEVLAIEAEARAVALDEARAAVLAQLNGFPDVNYVRVAALAAIDALQGGRT